MTLYNTPPSLKHRPKVGTLCKGPEAGALKIVLQYPKVGAPCCAMLRVGALCPTPLYIVDSSPLHPCSLGGARVEGAH